MRPVKFQYPGVPSSKAPISRCRGNCPLPNRKRITAGRRPGLPATYFPHLPADSDERINCADRVAKAWTEAGDFEAAAAWIQSLPPLPSGHLLSVLARKKIFAPLVTLSPRDWV